MIIPNDIKFNRERYEKHDGPAKAIAMDWLKQLGFKDIAENLEESSGNFNKIWDVKGNHPKVGEWRIEAEIKRDWGTKWKEFPFKWPTMDIPYRKRDKAEEHATHHMIIGGDLKRFFVVKRQAVLDSPVSEKWVKNRKRREPFFNVKLPNNQSAFWLKTKGKWERC